MYLSRRLRKLGVPPCAHGAHRPLVGLLVLLVFSFVCLHRPFACAASEPLTFAEDSNDYRPRTANAYPARRIFAMACSPDGLVLAAAEEDGTIKVREASTLRVLDVLSGLDAPVTSVAFSGDGRRLAATCENGKVRLWNVAAGFPIASNLAHDRAAVTAAFSPNGEWLATGGYDKSVRLCRVASGEQQLEFKQPAAVRAVCFSPDGKYLVVGRADGMVVVLRASEGSGPER